jgi:hypothetical protein
MIFVVPLGLLWLVVLASNPSPAKFGVAAIGTLMIGPVLWYRIKLGLHRGQRW